MDNLEYKYKNMTPFKWFIIENFPFLEDSIDGLTNYQLLVKLGDEINKNRDAINSIGENEEQVVNAFNELNNYVNSYFNNLDVQDEINNKLDQMATDGSLTVLINEYINPYIDETHELINEQNNVINSLNNKISLAMSGAPLVANSINDMTDTTKIYVLVGNGNWYYYNGTEWVSGGSYQGAVIESGSIYPYMLNNEVLHKREIQETIVLGDIVNRRIMIDGTISPTSTAGYYTRVNCLPGQKLYCNHWLTIGWPIISFYQSDNRFISNVTSTSQGGHITAEVPHNTAYALVQSSDPVNLSTNNIKLYTVDTVVYPEDTSFEDVIDTFEDITSPVTPEQIQAGKTSNSYISKSTGSVQTLNGLYASNYIELPYDNRDITITSSIPFTTSSPDARGLAFYNSEREYVGGWQYQQVNETTIKVPQGTKYIRLTIRNNSQVINIKYNLADFFKAENTSSPLSTIIRDAGLVNIFDSFTCIGDSLTAGQLESNNTGTTVYNTIPEMSYPSHLARVTGANVLNLGYGGATCKSWFNNHNTEINEDSKTQAYIIALGTNDIGYNGSFDGSISDINVSDYTQNADTSVGNYGKIIGKIKEIQPKAKIFCCGIPNTRNSLETRTQANQLINQITQLFDNCYFLDFQTYGVSVSNVQSWKLKYYLGGHLNCLGYSEFAYMIITYLNYFIQNKYNDFKQIQFIGTDKSYS